MDLKTGFHQNRIAPDNIKLTASNSNYDNFKTGSSPTEYLNAPKTFQTLTNKTFRNYIDKILIICLGNIFVFNIPARSLSWFMDDKQFEENKKWKLVRNEIKYLDLLGASSGFKTENDWEALVRDLFTQNNIIEIKSFLSLVQNFHMFIRDFFKPSASVTSLTQRNGSIATWDVSWDAAIEHIKIFINFCFYHASFGWTQTFWCHKKFQNE